MDLTNELRSEYSRLKQRLGDTRVGISELEQRIGRMEEENRGVAQNTYKEKYDLEVQLDEIKEMIAQLEEEKDALNELSKKNEEMKGEILAKIHSENVTCYRNIKSLVVDQNEKDDSKQVELGEESMDEIHRSFRGWKFFSFFSFLSFVVLLFILLIEVGYIVI